MDWDRFAGNWKQFGGKIKEKWGQLIVAMFKQVLASEFI